MAKIRQNKVIHKVLRRVRPYSAYLACSLVLALAYVAMTLYIPILVGNAIDCRPYNQLPGRHKPHIPS